MRRVCLVVGFLVLAGAGAAGVGVLMVWSHREWALARVDSALVDPKGGFTLHVSNQSYAAKRVDVCVEVDGELVVADWFYVGNQHVFKDFNLALRPGGHKIRIWSRKGQAEYSGAFEMAEGKIGVICYWYGYGEKTGGPPRLTFDVQDGPLLIM